MWSTDEMRTAWGFTDTPVTANHPEPENRCWRCDSRRIHLHCAAGLCEACCQELRSDHVVAS